MRDERQHQQIASFAGRVLLGLLAVAAVLAACAGCAPRTADDGAGFDPAMYQDRATGCMYLATGNYHALTPRIATDGYSHMGCKGASK